jgi:flavin reductase (DIM6/NTAB) family NADH-FMN oxidoreductase RutF
LKEAKFTDVSKELLEQLQKGAFLTVRSQGKVNTMTIAWGSLGYMWNRPVFIAMVRYSRYTYQLIKDADSFAVSFPLKGQYKEALSLCGTRSGRDIDKFAECGLKLKDGQRLGTPMIDGCDLHLECRIVYKRAMEPETLDDGIKAKSYSDGDYHVMFYGEIAAVYRSQ